MLAELAFQLRHPCSERLNQPDLPGDDRPQLHNDRRLRGNGRGKLRFWD